MEARPVPKFPSLAEADRETPSLLLNVRRSESWREDRFSKIVFCFFSRKTTLRSFQKLTSTSSPEHVDAEPARNDLTLYFPLKHICTLYLETYLFSRK